MKNPPIWESASRPLFVKSVWLDAGRRHFILDHEPRRKNASASRVKPKREPVQTSVSWDFTDLDEELQLVGSAKTQYHQGSTHERLMSTGNTRRLSSRRQFLDHFRRQYDYFRDEVSSKRSSAYDMNSVLTTNSHSDEKLAERVLNWLDLAGKTPLLGPDDSAPRTSTGKNKARKEIQKVQQQHQEPAACWKRFDSVKHITIIFNKEGVPVRFNRPARNIDLCALSSSASVVRRMAGNLASARLYEDSMTAEARCAPDVCDVNRPRPRTTSYRTTTTNEAPVKRPATERKLSAFSDVKRQLHIFMPSLPKKTLSPDDGVGNDLARESSSHIAPGDG